MLILNRTTFRPDESTPLYQQLYEHLRAAILSGQLKQGAKLPSTRALALCGNALERAYLQRRLEEMEG